MSGEKISKLERLLNLTALLLQTRRPLTVEEIGSKMQGYPSDPDSFRRQFERDKDELRSAGVPLDVVQLDASDLSEFGYRIPPERYYLPDPGFADDEVAALRVALASISLDTEAGAAALSKFGIDAVDGTDDAAPSGPIADVSVPDTVATLRLAIAESRCATFAFKSETRTVEPHRLAYLNGRWYLTAFDRLRNDVRNFRVDRIGSDITLGDPSGFTPPTDIEGLSIEPWRFGSDDPVDAVVRIDADHVAVVRDQFGSDARWRDLDDGSAEVTCAVRGREPFRTFVVSMLDHAELVGPEALRSWFITRLEGR